MEETISAYLNWENKERWSSERSYVPSEIPAEQSIIIPLLRRREILDVSEGSKSSNYNEKIKENYYLYTLSLLHY